PKRVSVQGERRERASRGPGYDVGDPRPIGAIVDVVMTGHDQTNAHFHEKPVEPVSLFPVPVQPMVSHDRKERFVEKDELGLKRPLQLSLEPVELLFSYHALFPWQLRVE